MEVSRRFEVHHFKSVGFAAFVLVAACNGGTTGGGGSIVSGGAGGGAQASGGKVGSGGVVGTGGLAGTGGTLASGGAGGSGSGGATLSGTGGGLGTGGSSATGSGGAKASGGASGTGGTKASGGAQSTGGAVATGGAASTGGAKGTGGATASIDGGAGSGGAGALPYKGVANCTCAERTSLKVSWYYNWTVSPDNCSTGGEFVPMYSNHPNNHPTSDAVAAQITKLVNAGYEYVLGFNEPNKTDQANMTVADAIALWPAMTSNPNILVGSPATSADGQAWFNDFYAQAKAANLRIDFIALHWYGWNSGSCDAKAANLESYIKWAEGLTGSLPIWLTEWGCMNASNPDVATVQAFYTGALAMLAKHPRVERYAWYQWDPNNELTNTDHSLTALGTVYASEPSTR